MENERAEPNWIEAYEAYAAAQEDRLLTVDIARVLYPRPWGLHANLEALTKSTALFWAGLVVADLRKLRKTQAALRHG